MLERRFWASAMAAVAMAFSIHPAAAADLGGTSRTGLRGFLRSYSASLSPAGESSFKLMSGFFLADNLMIEGYKHQSIDTALSYTHPMSGLFPFDRLEFSLAMQGKTHSISVPDAGKIDNAYFGDLTVGLKYLAWKGRFLRASILVQPEVRSSAEKTGWTPSSASPTLLLLNSFNLGYARMHLNTGAFFDRSEKALGLSRAETERPLLFAQGASIEDSWIASFTAEVPIRRTTAYVEWVTYQDMDGKAYSTEATDPNSVAFDRKKVGFAQNPIWLTPGIKSSIGDRWSIEGAVELGFLSGDFPGETDREILPPWRALLGVAYSTGRTKSLRLASARDAESPHGALLTGRVSDARTGEPLSDARIQLGSAALTPLSSIPGGHFEYEHLPEGRYEVEVEMEGYESIRREVEALDGSALALDLKLTPLAPEPMPTVPTAQVASVAPPAEIDLAANSMVPVEPARALSTERIVELLQQVTFKFNTTVLPLDFQPILDEVAGIMKDHPSLMLRVVGHTDESGQAGLNRWISLQRAIAVADYLAAQGVDRKRLVPVGLGGVRPAAPNETWDGRRQNRRVDFENVVPAQWSIQFEFDSVTPPRASLPILDQFATHLGENPSLSARIEGHSDGKGSPVANMKVSRARAASVARYLLSKGVARDRLTPVGFGSHRPIADNRTEEGRALNRRVELLTVEPSTVGDVSSAK